MKQFPKTERITLLSVFSGVVGMAMQSWLFTTTDNRGLLIRFHISAVISYLLFAAVVVVTFLFVKNMLAAGAHRPRASQSVVAALGSFGAAVGLGFSALSPLDVSSLQIPLQILGLLGAAMLLFTGYCRLRGKRISCMTYVPLILFLIFRTLVFCQVWSATVQVDAYFFPLLAELFLLIYAYHRATLRFDPKSTRGYLFFRQLACFCCLLATAGDQGIFYLAGAVWTATDFCIPSIPEADAE